MNTYDLLARVRPIELGQALKRILNLKRVLVESEGCRFSVDPLSNFGGRLLSGGSYEKHTTVSLLSILKEGDIFVDVGANEGWYSILAARAVGTSGLVIAIEPQERCWQAINRNFSLNRMLNYRLMPYAVGDIENEQDIVLYPSLNNEASSLVTRRRTRRFKRQRTQIMRLDSIAKGLNLPAIDLLKIDCEGYELKVLRGAEGILRQGLVRQLLIETHPEQLEELGDSESQVANYLSSIGFRPARTGDFNWWTQSQ